MIHRKKTWSPYPLILCSSDELDVEAPIAVDPAFLCSKYHKISAIPSLKKFDLILDIGIYIHTISSLE